MINRLIKEINDSIANNCFIAALALALTLPDVCGKAEYPQLGVSDRYKSWYKEYAVPRFEGEDVPEESPYPTETEVYKLRCLLLHQASTEIDTKSLENRSSFSKKHGAPKFNLKLNHTNRGHLVYCNSHNAIDDDGTETLVVDEYYYEVDVITLCSSICNAAQRYYAANKEKFGFVDFVLIE